jgi:hypothetical protein
MGGGTGTGKGLESNADYESWRVVDFSYDISTKEARGLLRYLAANLSGNCSISLYTIQNELFEKPDSLKVKPKTVEERVNSSYGVSLEKTGFIMSGEIYRDRDDSCINYAFEEDSSNYPVINKLYRMELSHGSDRYDQLEDSERELVSDIKSTVARYFLDKEELRKRRERSEEKSK